MRIHEASLLAQRALDSHRGMTDENTHKKELSRKRKLFPLLGPLNYLNSPGEPHLWPIGVPLVSLDKAAQSRRGSSPREITYLRLGPFFSHLARGLRTVSVLGHSS